MEFFELTEKRRSVRAYDAIKAVTREQIEKIICAAQQAPSWKNRQPSRFYCLLTGEKHDLFRRECLPERNAAKSVGAALIVTTFVKNVSGFSEDGQTADNECGNGWGYYDLGLASENICLAAKNMGLDSLIMGLRDGEKIRAFLSLPENEQVVSIIAVGYAAESPAKPARKAIGEVLKFI